MASEFVTPFRFLTVCVEHFRKPEEAKEYLNRGMIFGSLFPVGIGHSHFHRG